MKAEPAGVVIEGIGNFHASASQVIAQLSCIRGLERDLNKPVLRVAGEVRINLNVLVIVHLETGILRDFRQIGEPEQLPVELARGRDVVSAEGNMSDPDDGRPFHRASRGA